MERTTDISGAGTATSLRLDSLAQRYPALAISRNILEEAFCAMRDALHDKHKILLCGNGGSAADADHWAGELLKGFARKRSLSDAEREDLPSALADSLQGALPAIPLTAMTALSTAFANDVAPELVFAQLVWALGCSGDIFIGISTSGNASNVCAAADVARAKGMTTIALTGSTGGALKEHSDIAICVPATETYLVQEMHLPVYHCLSLMLEDEFFPEN